jgi:type III pantothenate kinase
MKKRFVKKGRKAARRVAPQRAAARPTPRRGGARPTLLCIDVGNSHAGIGLVSADRVGRMWRITGGTRSAAEVEKQVAVVLQQSGRGRALSGVVLCSAVPSLTARWRRALERATGKTPLVAGVKALTGMQVRYRDPSDVGADRLANAVGARALYGAPAIVVDLGTATTFDCVSGQGDFVGGAIAPGVALSAEALSTRAPHLPRVPIERPGRALGRNTREALQSGVVFGAAAMVDGLVLRLAKEMKARPQVIATGGLAWTIARRCEAVHHVDEGLTMKGLARMWEEAQ